MQNVENGMRHFSLILSVARLPEYLLPEEEPPWGVPLLRALLLGVLLALGDGVHHVVAAAAQGGHLHGNRERKALRFPTSRKEKQKVP